MKIGYARTSTDIQKFSIEHQVETLQKVGCEKIFTEEQSAVYERPIFDQAIDFVREGDTFIVTSLSRFSRSISDMIKHVEILQKKNVTFNILDMNLDTSTSTGRLILNIMGSIYQFERELLLERQRIGIIKAKEKGVKLGNKFLNTKKVEEIRLLKSKGYKVTDIMNEVGVSRSCVYKYIANNPSNSVLYSHN